MARLILPASFIQRLNLPVVARLAFSLVGDARMIADVALGEIEWLGQRRTVEVKVSGGEDALIGTEMLDTTVLVIDYATRSVSITK